MRCHVGGSVGEPGRLASEPREKQNMKTDPVVSAVITMHGEGILAHRTLLSIQRCREYAEARGLRTEFVITLDNATAETRRVVTSHPALRDDDQVHEVNFRDLSLSRNFAIEKARGEYVGTFDGDDYFSKNWIERCVRGIEENGPTTIYHPELMVAFGALNAYWWQPDQLGKYYTPECLLTMNLWNACAFAKRSVFVAYPYQVSRPGESGFGYEDWLWNCDTIAAGYVHRTAPETIRFERRKSNGSLNVAHQRTGAVIRPSAFFDQV